MAIVRHQQILPSHVIHGNQIVNSLFESVESLVMVQITDMLADKCLAIHYQCDRVLKIRSHGQYRLLVLGALPQRPAHSLDFAAES